MHTIYLWYLVRCIKSSLLTTSGSQRLFSTVCEMPPSLEIAIKLLAKLPRPLRESIMPDMRIPPISNNPSKVQLVSIAHVYFEHPDPEKFGEFAKDFGFVEAHRINGRIYYRGYGRDPFIYVASQSPDGKPRFRGPAFVAASQDEFDKAAKLDGASIGSLDEAPGKGQIVTVNRPDKTFFHAIYGQEERITSAQEPLAIHEQLGPFNKPFEKPRRGQWYPCLRGLHHVGFAKVTTRQVPALPRGTGTCP